MSQEQGRIVTSREGGIARVTLANPGRKNAITLDMARALVEFCDVVDRDESVGAVIIDAEGSYFCSGADTRDLASSSANPASTEALVTTSTVYGSFTRFGQLTVPTVACVAGGAVGAGLNLAMAADVMLVTPDAVLESGFLARAIHPGGGHLHLLGRTLNRTSAFAVGVLGVSLTGSEAVRRGFAWDAVDADSLVPTALQLVQRAAADPALTRRIANSAALELATTGVNWPSAVELERGIQMWSLGRKGEHGWASPPQG